MRGFFIASFLLISILAVLGEKTANFEAFRQAISAAIKDGKIKPLNTTSCSNPLADVQGYCNVDFSQPCSQAQESVNCVYNKLVKDCGKAVANEACQQYMQYINCNGIYCPGDVTTTSCSDPLADVQGYCNIDLNQPCSQAQKSVNCVYNKLVKDCGKAVADKACQDYMSLVNCNGIYCPGDVATTSCSDPLADVQGHCNIDMNQPCSQAQESVNCVYNQLVKDCGKAVADSACQQYMSLVHCSGIYCSASSLFISGSIVAILLYKMLVEKFLIIF